MPEKTIAVPETEAALETQETTRQPERFVRPAVDIYETRESLIVLADIAGADKSTVDLEVENSILTVRANPKHVMPVEPNHREFELAPYWRQFELSEAVDTNGITADYKSGVLSVQLPKSDRLKPRRIAVDCN